MQSTPYLSSPPPRRPRSLQIEISGIPAENGKCRVETQLKIGFHLRGPHGDTVLGYKQIRLPRTLIAKEKHRIEKFNGRDKHLQDSEILFLDTRLVCDHDMTKILECCDNCIGRERKRAHRRKETQKLPGPLGSIPVFGAINPKSAGAAAALAADQSDPPTPTDPVEYQAWERSRVMVFSSTEYVDISAGECVLPTRITCYCRHHNEKVGFRIQFTARDSIGAIVASVLTNPVMMMDDHKSGKRAVPAEARASAGAANRRSMSLPCKQQQAKQEQLHDQQDHEDAEREDYCQEDDDELDLEAGRRIPYAFGANGSRMDDEDDIKLSSKDILAPLELTSRMVTKRRVDDDYAMEDIQAQHAFRRKTSHDITQPSAFAVSAFPFAATNSDSTLSSPTPFMTGSPFASEDGHNAFSPSFGHAMGSNGSMTEHHNGDVFSLGQRSASIHSIGEEQDYFRHQSVSLLDNFTTLDETMSSPTPFSAGHGPEIPGGAFRTRASFSVPTTVQQHASSSVLYSPVSPFPPTATAGLNSSFLDTTQMQEFQKFQRQQQLHQQRQFQQFQQGIPQQQPQQHSASLDASMQVPWSTTPTSETRDPFQSMNATSPSTSAYIPIPASLPDNIGSEYTDLDGYAVDSNGYPMASKKRGRPRKHSGMIVVPPMTPFSGAPASGASSPMISPKAPSTNMPASPSPPPFLGHPSSTATTPTMSTASSVGTSGFAGVGSTSAAAAAQFLLYQQQQQQQQQQLYQQHQQQMQHQQRQAILARQDQQQQQQQQQEHQLQQFHHHQQQLQQQRPRVQKVIPAKGSVQGGEEITLLGSGFFPGIVPTFDGIPAPDVQFFGPETIVCRLPPRTYPGAVVVKAQRQQQNNMFMNSAGVAAVAAAAAAAAVVRGEEHLSASNPHELVRTMSQFLGGASAASLSMPHGNGDSDDEDEDEGSGASAVLFEYEEDKGDRDLIALALQVLGIKMNGRVEPPHQVAMRIMATAAAQQQQLAEQQAKHKRLQLEQEQQQQQQQHHHQQQQLQLQLQKQHRRHSTIMGTPVSSAAGNSGSSCGSTVMTVMKGHGGQRGPAPVALTPIPLQSPQSQWEV
ncbi:hypothetical protein EDD21DRAFT_418332 [Dissophora ornata]|nr:hypothetical protein BGZ58_007792 [Dissophora ornata]KAI8597831.1 hypothetical protein EDD21DRAFT_418332 [Dissophora ornata]